MIIWRGLGILVIPIALVVVILSILLTSLFVEGDVLESSIGNVAMGIGFIISAVPIWFLGKWLHSRSKRIVIDKETGREYNVGRTHSLFFIPMEYWSIAAVLLGLLLCFAK